MAGFKIDRITSDVHIAMADILRDIKDPRVSKMLSIIKVQVTNDLSYATFYVSAIEGKEMTDSSVKALKGAAGYIRKELGSRVKMRKVPEVRFVADDSIAFSAHLSSILNSFEGGEKANEENS